MMTKKHENNWDNRYDEERFFYGREPNYLVARELPKLQKGRGLFLAEGEGRNIVFAAGLGHDVVAVDNSFVGQRKAMELAAGNSVEIEYRLDDLITGNWDSENWDFVVLCFVHMPPDVMGDVHRRVVESLNPNGTVVFCSFEKGQFGRHSGGPPQLEMLHDAKVVASQLDGLNWDYLQIVEVELRESVGHFGRGVVLEGVGVKGG
ncbi:MAG: class I SAM-dependent methyltransferase [bacterium]|nr:class I SAM-dependent methyltransferase [bacterium]